MNSNYEVMPISVPVKSDEFAKLSQFIDSNKAEIYLDIVKIIEYAIKKNFTDANIFKFENDNFLYIKKIDWDVFLNYAISYFSEIEDYETCSKIKQVLNKLI